MAINTQLPFAAQAQPLQMPDPNSGMNALARAMAIKSAMGQSDLHALQLQEAQRGIADTNALNGAYKGAVGADGAVDRNRLFSTLADQNLGSKIPGLQKQFLDTDTAAATLGKTQADTQKTNLEMGIKKAEHAASLFSLAKDPQSYAVVRAMMKQQLGQDLPEQFDPNFVQAQVAMGQTITQKLAAEHQRLTFAESQRHNVSTERNAAGQLGESRRHNTAMEGYRGQEVNGVEQQFTPAAIDNAAARYNIDGTLPPMGMGKAGAMGRSAILNRAAELAAGVDPQQQRIDQIGNKANSAALSKLQQQQTMVGAFEKNFNKNADIALELSQRVDRTGIPLANKWLNAGKRAIAGDPDLAAFDQAIKSASNEYAKIISGSMGNTAVAEGEIKKMEQNLNAAQTPEQVSAVLALMKRETQNRMTAFEEEKAGLRTSMTGKKAPEAPPGGVPPDIAEILKKHGGK